MTDAEVAARGQQAEHAWDQFIAPVIEDYRNHLLARIAEVAVNELDSRLMADKQRNLSTALKVTDEIAKSIQRDIKDGEYAQKKLLTINRIEDMPAAKRRLLNIGPARY